MPVRHVDHQRDGAAMREEDMLDLVARSREDRIWSSATFSRSGASRSKSAGGSAAKRRLPIPPGRFTAGDPL
jgi:hypothetical protein